MYFSWFIYIFYFSNSHNLTQRSESFYLKCCCYDFAYELYNFFSCLYAIVYYFVRFVWTFSLVAHSFTMNVVAFLFSFFLLKSIFLVCSVRKWILLQLHNACWILWYFTSNYCQDFAQKYCWIICFFFVFYLLYRWINAWCGQQIGCNTRTMCVCLVSIRTQL